MDIISIENAWKKLWLLARVVVLYAVVLSEVLKEVEIGTIHVNKGFVFDSWMLKKHCRNPKT